MGSSITTAYQVRSQSVQRPKQATNSSREFETATHVERDETTRVKDSQHIKMGTMKKIKLEDLVIKGT